MRTDFMASAKQIAWRKKFARMAKAGKFKKSKKSKSNLPQKKTTKPKPVNPKDYGTEKDTHQIPQHMLDELLQSKVRGFPFFAYTGIKDYLLMGNDSLMLKPIPPNPNQISAIQINYDKGADGFHIVFYRGNDRLETTKTLYVGDLADTIVQKMGVS